MGNKDVVRYSFQVFYWHVLNSVGAGIERLQWRTAEKAVMGQKCFYRFSIRFMNVIKMRPAETNSCLDTQNVIKSFL